MFCDVVDEVEGQSDLWLLSRLVSIEERRRVLEAEQAVVLAELEGRRVYACDGHATMWGLLRALTGWSDAECRVRMRVARLVGEHRDVGECLWQGWSSVANVAEIARGFANPRCGDQIVDVIGTLVNQSKQMEFDDFKVVVRQWERRADVDGAHRDTAANHEARNAHCVVFDGVGHLAVQWGEADGFANREIFDHYLDAEWRTDWAVCVERHGDDACKVLMPRTDAQRRADAITRIFSDAASRPVGSTAAQPVLNVHVDWTSFNELMVYAGVFPDRVVDPFEDGAPPVVTDRRCATEHGDPVDPNTVIQIALEGHVRFVVVDDAGVPIQWGRTKRLFDGAARDAVMSLSPRCTHPGCRRPARRCHADHTVEYSRGGPTDPGNGGIRCPTHNLIKNRGYTVQRDHGGRWHTYRPDGTEIPNLPA